MSASLTNATASTSTVSSESQQYIAAPFPVMTHTTRSVSGSRDPLDDFFGSTMSTSRTHDSRHDERTQSLADVPPAYAEESAIPLPEYSLHAPEPVTLAMYLFKFGFLFPPFWFFGAFILLSPLREPPSTSDSIPAWMPEKTEEERQQIIANIREVELKWSRRCLWAFIILTILASSSAVAASFLLRQ